MTHPNYVWEYKKERLIGCIVAIGLVSFCVGLVCWAIGDFGNAVGLAFVAGGIVSVCVSKVALDRLVDTSAAKLVRTWQKLDLGTPDTFPATDYQRKGYRPFAQKTLYGLAEAAVTTRARFLEAETRLTMWRMPEPLPVVNEVGGRVMRDEERESLRHQKELQLDLVEADYNQLAAENKFQKHWAFFEAMAIGDGKSMPKNMLPAHKDGSHWQHATAFKLHVASRHAAGLSAEAGHTPSADV